MKRQNLRTVSLIIATFTYLLVGAAIFGWLESENEREQKELLRIIEGAIQRRYNISEEDLSVLTTILLKSVPHKAGTQWKFPGAFYFATTVVTTIGYGHSTPSTTGGRCFCMIYALIGIPLGLVMFQSIGERLNTIVRSGLKCAKRCFKAKNSEVSQANVVAVVSILSTILMTSMAAVFASYERWDYFDALYYCFITLTTIGFGDYVALQKDSALQEKPQYVVLSLVFILFGLSVVSSAVNLLVLKFLTLNTEDERRDEQLRYTANLNPILLEGDVITPASRHRQRPIEDRHEPAADRRSARKGSAHHGSKPRRRRNKDLDDEQPANNNRDTAGDRKSNADHPRHWHRSAAADETSLSATRHLPSSSCSNSDCPSGRPRADFYQRPSHHHHHHLEPPGCQPSSGGSTWLAPCSHQHRDRCDYRSLCDIADHESSLGCCCEEELAWQPNDLTGDHHEQSHEVDCGEPMLCGRQTKPAKPLSSQQVGCNHLDWQRANRRRHLRPDDGDNESSSGQVGHSCAHHLTVGHHHQKQRQQQPLLSSQSSVTLIQRMSSKPPREGLRPADATTSSRHLAPLSDRAAKSGVAASNKGSLEQMLGRTSSWLSMVSLGLASSVGCSLASSNGCNQRQPQRQPPRRASSSGYELESDLAQNATSPTATDCGGRHPFVASHERLQSLTSSEQPQQQQPQQQPQQRTMGEPLIASCQASAGGGPSTDKAQTSARRSVRRLACRCCCQHLECIQQALISPQTSHKQQQQTGPKDKISSNYCLPSDDERRPANSSSANELHTTTGGGLTLGRSRDRSRSRSATRAHDEAPSPSDGMQALQDEQPKAGPANSEKREMFSILPAGSLNPLHNDDDYGPSAPSVGAPGSGSPTIGRAQE